MAEGNIIIKKVKKVQGGAHGGAWKVAYADFVTAMMAFFLLLWLLNVTTDEQKSGIADYFAPDGNPFHADRKMLLYWARLNTPGRDAATDFTYLLDTGATAGTQANHAHPFLSPDGRLAFFNSDESGVSQAYMLRGLPH